MNRPASKHGAWAAALLAGCLCGCQDGSETRSGTETLDTRTASARPVAPRAARTAGNPQRTAEPPQTAKPPPTPATAPEPRPSGQPGKVVIAPLPQPMVVLSPGNEAAPFFAERDAGRPVSPPPPPVVYGPSNP